MVAYIGRSFTDLPQWILENGATFLKNGAAPKFRRSLRSSFKSRITGTQNFILQTYTKKGVHIIACLSFYRPKIILRGKEKWIFSRFLIVKNNRFITSLRSSEPVLLNLAKTTS